MVLPCKAIIRKSFDGKTPPSDKNNKFMEHDKLLEHMSHYLPTPFDEEEFSAFREYLR